MGDLPKADKGGQPTGDPSEMAEVNGFCPFISTTTVLMAQGGSQFDPNQKRQTQPLVMPMFSPCVADRCALWSTKGKGMCSFKSIAFDLRTIGDHTDAKKFL